MAPVDLAEAKQELGLSRETLDSFAVHGRSDSDRKGKVAVMTDLEVGPETQPPSRPPPPVRFEDQCAEIMAFLESIDAEALSASRKKGCLDNLLSAAEAWIWVWIGHGRRPKLKAKFLLRRRLRAGGKGEASSRQRSWRSIHDLGCQYPLSLKRGNATVLMAEQKGKMLQAL